MAFVVPLSSSFVAGEKRNSFLGAKVDICAPAKTAVTPAKPVIVAEAQSSTSRRKFLAAGATFLAVAAGAKPSLAYTKADALSKGISGSAETIDLNNANIRLYSKLPGMYPGIAKKIVSNAPYSSVGEVFNIEGLTAEQKEIIKKYESRFIVSEPYPGLTYDNFNNGIYK